jgi:Mycothiol maleylpyruvate isomerase N-terminal domain
VTPIREAYLTAADSARSLLALPVVGAAWTEPSALAGFTVGGLASHLAAQVLFVSQALTSPEPTGDVVSLLGHYERVQWIGAELDADVNVAIRSSGERSASEGAAAVLSHLDEAIAVLREALPSEPLERLVAPPAGPWTLRIDDFIITRMMEIAVHSDDLACSVAVPTPALPPDVLDPVFALLTNLAVRRHGPTAVLRALSRAERAPATVTAF